MPPGGTMAARKKPVTALGPLIGLALAFGLMPTLAASKPRPPKPSSKPGASKPAPAEPAHPAAPSGAPAPSPSTAPAPSASPADPPAPIAKPQKRPSLIVLAVPTTADAWNAAAQVQRSAEGLAARSARFEHRPAVDVFDPTEAKARAAR